MEPEFLIVLYGSNYKGFTTPSHHACTLCFLTYTACFCAKAQTHFALNAFKLFVFIFLKPFLYQLQLLRIPIEPAFGADVYKRQRLDDAPRAVMRLCQPGRPDTGKGRLPGPGLSAPIPL